MKRLFAILAFILVVGTSQAQQKMEVNPSDYQNTKVEMADRLRADGKIYVLVGVITTILAGLFVYTIRIDGKLSKLEKEFNSQK